MEKHVFRKPFFVSYLIPIIFSMGMVVMVMYGLSVTENSSHSEGVRILEESIRRAVITCYAIEGSYPSDISHIEEYYGVFIDRARYKVHYDIFASNIMPSISIITLE